MNVVVIEHTVKTPRKGTKKAVDQDHLREVATRIASERSGTGFHALAGGNRRRASTRAPIRARPGRAVRCWDRRDFVSVRAEGTDGGRGYAFQRAGLE